MIVDLEAILERGADDFKLLKGLRIFVTGGTGFVGSWILESFAHANRRLKLDAHLDVLTRDPERFCVVAPHLSADASINLVRGDVLTFCDLTNKVDAIVHAATTASAKLNTEEPLVMIDTVVTGTRRILELARQHGKIPLLLTSTGGVYGSQPSNMALVDETYTGAPDPLDPRFAYHESKRLAEMLCAVIAATSSTESKIARLYAFVGPYLPLDRHFAIGNFIRDALSRGPIVIAGDGTPVRTYMYAADMTSWLWRILLRGKTNRPYNVGSERTIDIESTAKLVANYADTNVSVKRIGTPLPGQIAERYACSTQRARTELDLAQWTSLEDAVARTFAWHRAKIL